MTKNILLEENYKNKINEVLELLLNYISFISTTDNSITKKHIENIFLWFSTRLYNFIKNSKNLRIDLDEQEILIDTLKFSNLNKVN